MAIPPTSVTLREGSLLHVGIIQIMEEAAFLSFASDGLPLGTFVLAYEGVVKKKKFRGLQKVADFTIFPSKYVKRSSSSYHPMFEHYSPVQGRLS